MSKQALPRLVCLGLITACAPLTPTPSQVSGSEQTSDQTDCVVIAAVARDHYRFNATDNPPLPVRFDGNYSPRCDWQRLGMRFTPYDPSAAGDPRQRLRWVSFGRPTYDGRGATVSTGIMHGPLVGMGYECRVTSGFSGWTVAEGACRATWVS
jgi:hypothetical protein